MITDRLSGYYNLREQLRLFRVNRNFQFSTLIFQILVACVMALTVVGCSTKKNTAMTRRWHAFTGRYNTYYNGTLAYIDGSLEKEKGNQDNYTEQIPLYTVGNKKSREIGKGHFETAITKAQKTIQLHSIKAKPEWTKDRRKTAKDIEWLSRREYNPFLWRAWMLMGRSQFYKGSFDEAAATFSYMSRLYKGQPAIYGKARAWLAKCYIENDWLYDAEDVIRNMQRDSIDWRAQKEWDYTLCDYYLHTGENDKAIEYLRKVIKHEMRSKQRAREYFLLGQLLAAQGQREQAYEAFRKTVKQNPPYILDFNARIAMTEVMAQGQAKKMISRLRRMARNDNNKDYLDQVYYAIGNIYLAEKDTANAISAYEKGNEKATRSGVEKGVLLLHLGDLYWAREQYGDAQRCYGEAIGLLDKDRPDYEELSRRSKILDELAPYTESIHLQDSLQALGRMSEPDRNAAIDRVIEALKKKEKEEEAKAAEDAISQAQQKYAPQQQQNRPAPVTPKMQQPGSTTWYFYSPQAVNQGKQTFQRLWGRRENVDDWQRNNKTVVAGAAGDAEEMELTEAQRDSIAQAEELKAKEEERLDSAVNDPHKREYYIAQIPFTEEQIAASNDIIKDALLHSAIIFKDKLDNLPLSKKAFDRLMIEFPEFEPKDEVYYHLFLLHSRRGETAEAQAYVDSLAAQYPESKLTTLLTDQYFVENAVYGKQIEDSIYGATYEAFKADRSTEVYRNNELSASRFPLGDNRDRFIFLDGMTRLNNGDPDSCVRAMERIVKEYPKSVVSEMAGMIVNGVKEGRRLRGTKFDLTGVWDRRTMVMENRDTTDAQRLSDERNANFLFIFAYPPDSIDENKLLFQVARFNFTNFLGRAFDMTIEDAAGLHHLTISGFRNYDEARQYSLILLQQEGVRTAMGKARPIVISEENLQMLGTRYSYNEYDEFFDEHFSSLKVLRPEMLYEPDIVTEAEQDAKRQPARAATDEREAERRAMKGEDDPVTPALPTEEVAPGGAMPTTPKSEEEAEIEEETTIPIAIDIPETPETPAAEPAETTIPEAPEASETPANPAETIIPEAPETPDNPAEITIPETPESPETPANPAEITIPVTPEAPETPDNPAEITIPDTPDSPSSPSTPSENPAEISIPATPESPQSTDNPDEIIIVDDSENKGEVEDVEIIVEDEKPSTDALEDEYYELDGF